MLGYCAASCAVERVEVYAVSAKLAVIAGIVAALVFFDSSLVAGGGWTPPPLGATIDAGDMLRFSAC